MAKRPRRRAVVLESDDEEDGEIPDGKALGGSFASAQESAQSSADSRKMKLQKTSQQPSFDSLFEHQSSISSLFENKKAMSKKGPHGKLPLEIIVKSNAKIQASIRTKKGRASATLADHQKLEKHFDDRLWVDKYSPKSVGDLVVHPKKVAEVKDWLQGQLLTPYGSQATNSRVLLLTGPAGVGKTAVVNVLAELLSIDLLEWKTPAPELWHEYSHHAASGAAYISKLDEFEAFLDRGRNVSLLPIVSVSPSTSQPMRSSSGDNKVNEKHMKVLFIDDLPDVSHNANYERLARSLYHLALSRNFPAIVVHTDNAGGCDRIEESDYQRMNVIDALERGGARKISFNPVTVNAMTKLLSRVQRLENSRISSESLSVIAGSSAGDIRQSLTSLQYLSLGFQSSSPYHLMWDPGGSTQVKPVSMQTIEKNAEETHVQINKSCTGVGVGREYSLSLFHALGKFLHNKRHPEEPVDSGVKLKGEFQRRRLNMAEPEAVLCQAHTNTTTVLAFLHENVLQFIDEDAIDDVAAVASYFSDTDYVLGARGNFRSRNSLINSDDIGPSQVADAAASSVAARGVLFGNGHPAPSRWQSLRTPAIWQVDRQLKHKKAEIFDWSIQGLLDIRAVSKCIQATELYPFNKRISGQIPCNILKNHSHLYESVERGKIVEFEHREKNHLHANFQDGEVIKLSFSDLEKSFSQICFDDDIEDYED